MDKKGLRSGQNSSQKSLVTDQKRDVGNGARPWPGGGRGGFNRAGNASNSVPSTTKNELARSKPRYNQQRYGGNSFGNKRPQQRGGGGYYQAESGGGNTLATPTGLESSVSDELHDGIEPELGSVFVQGTKKQNLNHLLNFHYTRDGADQRGNSRSGGGSRGRNGGGKVDCGRWITTEKHKYNKEHYLQANCQFIVKADGDYTKYLNNPDTLVDWDLIEQINIQVNEVPSCPICLYPSLAAKATRCGHVFCWSCILHYLALSDERWRKCPICYEAVHKQHLKSVVMIPHPTFPVHEKITFNLMKRLKGSLTAYPMDYFENPSSISSTNPQKINYSLHTLSDIQNIPSIHCKLVLATAQDVMNVIERERNDLLLQKMDLVSVEVNPELCFVEEALALLTERETQVLADGCSKSCIADNSEKIEQEISENASCIEVLPNLNEENSSELEAGFDLSKDFCESVLEEQISELGSPTRLHDLQNGAKTFYFYQASDGQHIYLHAINARMLEHTYGSLEFAPRSITGKILEKESGSITEQLRNRVRYLQHLPLTCQVEVAEIDLRAPVVNEETMEVFRAQLTARLKRRNLRNRSERRREKLILEHENRQLGRCLASSPMYTTDLHLDSPNHFPTVETSVALSLAESNSTQLSGFGAARFRSDSERSEAVGSSSSSPMGSVAGAGWWGSSLEGEGGDGGGVVAGTSFAKMLQQTPKPKSQASPWPVVSQTKSSSKQVNSRNANSEDSETEADYFPAPAYNKSFSDAIAMALAKASLQNNAKNTNDDGHTPTQGKKKKKTKQKVLFATSMSFTGH